jgi:hypothetical protein
MQAGLVGCGGLGVLGSGDGGGFGLACWGGVVFGLPGACVGVGDLAGGILAGGADVAVRIFAGLPDFRGCAGADAADLGVGSGAQLCEFAFEVFHVGNGLGGGVVGLFAVGAGGVHLGFGRLDVADGAQFGDRAGEGIRVLGGDLFQGVDEFGGAGDPERDQLPDAVGG